MPIAKEIFSLICHHSDSQRDAMVPEPLGVDSYLDLAYEKKQSKDYRLDVYRPSSFSEALPLLVIVHGGGYCYGTKEIYHLYAKDLAQRGFAVICYNYPSAPNKRFPVPLYCLDHVLSWASQEAKRFKFDLNHVYLVGDSAGAQIALQYEIIATNPAYRKLFSLPFACEVPVNALALGCGIYGSLGDLSIPQTRYIWDYYLPRHINLSDPRLHYLDYLLPSTPPCYVFSSEGDFLKSLDKFLVDALKHVNVPYEFKIYKTSTGHALGHVFHLNIVNPYARKAVDEQCAFLRRY